MSTNQLRKTPRVARRESYSDVIIRAASMYGLARISPLLCLFLSSCRNGTTLDVASRPWIPRLDHSVYWVRISKRVFGEAVETESISNVVHLYSGEKDPF